LKIQFVNGSGDVPLKPVCGDDRKTASKINTKARQIA
jgi:hypothetical protein